MCDRCHQAWLPTNHRNSHGFASFGDKFRSARMWAVKNPLAELRRTSKMRDSSARFAYRYRQSLAETRSRIERFR